MVFFGGFIGLVALAVWIFCIIDAITTPADQVRVLPKLAWIAIVIFFVDLGSLLWLLVGRPWNARAMTPGGPGGGARLSGGSGFSAPQRRRPVRPTNPDDDDEFLASLAKRRREDDRPDDDPGQPA